MDYTREEIKTIYPCQPIIEIEANKEIMDSHIYLDNERFQIRIKKKDL